MTEPETIEAVKAPLLTSILSPERVASMVIKAMINDQVPETHSGAKRLDIDGVRI